MTYNVFSGTLNPTHFTSLHVELDAGSSQHSVLLLAYYLGTGVGDSGQREQRSFHAESRGD